MTREVVFATLRAMAKVAPVGSTIVFDYMDADAFVPERASKPVQRMQEILRTAGEPMKAGFEPSTLAADLAGVGLRLDESLSLPDVERHYFQGRTDGFHAFQHAHFVNALVGQVARSKPRMGEANRISYSVVARQIGE